MSIVETEYSRDMLSELANHWHFRRNGRDVIATGDGMAAIGLYVSPEEVYLLRGCFLAAALNPALLEERPNF